MKEIHSFDAHKDNIAKNAVGHKVVFFKPQASGRDHFFTKCKTASVVHGLVHIKNNQDYRCAMIYAFSDDEQYVLVGTIKRNGLYKEV